MIYADTSLLLPVYVPEANSELANSVVRRRVLGSVRGKTIAPARPLEAAAIAWREGLEVQQYVERNRQLNEERADWPRNQE